MNPLLITYNALWKLLENSTEFCEMVKPGNRIKYSGAGRNPQKEQAITADYPEVRIVVTRTDPHLNRTSNGSSLKKHFAIQILTGSQQVDKMLELEWIIYKAMAGAYEALLDLSWPEESGGYKFIKLVKPVSIQEQLTMTADMKSHVAGWVSVWAVEIDMWFRTKDLSNGS